jgi:hypothetical protein
MGAGDRRQRIEQSASPSRTSAPLIKHEKRGLRAIRAGIGHGSRSSRPITLPKLPSVERPNGYRATYGNLSRTRARS